MPEVATKLKTYRFDQMAVQVKDKVHPDDADVDRYVGLEHIDPESLKIRRWGEPSDVTSTKILFRSGDIIFGKRRAYQRKLAVADFDGICSAHAMVLRPKTDVVLKEFLPFFMQTDTFMERAVKISVGGLSPTINWRDLAKEEFALPPIEEQARLVKALLAVQNYADRLLVLIDATRVAQIAAFEELLSRSNAVSTKIGSLITSSPRNGYSPVAASEPTGHWVLALSAISKFGYRPDQLKPVDPAPETITVLINKGDLVVSRSNTRDLVGLPMVFPEDRNDVSYPDTMMRISVDRNDVSTEFLELCLRTPKCRQQVQSYAAGTSSSMLKINGANLRKVEVPFVDFDTQISILSSVKRFSVMVRNGRHRFDHARSLQARLANSAINLDGGGI